MTDGRVNGPRHIHPGYRPIVRNPAGSVRHSHEGLKLVSRFVYNPRLVASPPRITGLAVTGHPHHPSAVRDPRRNGFAGPVIQYKQLRHAGMAIVVSPPAH